METSDNDGIATRRMLNIEEAAAVLAISRNTLVEQIQKGAVPAMRVGRQWRLDPALLARWVAEESAKPK